MVFIAPLIAGLASFIGAVITALVGFLAAYITRKVAMALVALAMIITVTAAFWALLSALLSGIAVVMPETLVVAASWILPGNIPQCFAVYMTARVLRMVYEIKMHGIQMRLI